MRRRQFRSLYAARKEGFTLYDRSQRVLIVWREVDTPQGKRYEWAEVQLDSRN